MERFARKHQQAVSRLERGLRSLGFKVGQSPASPYSHIRPERKEIRVLSLEPGQWNDQISCQLTTISLNEPYLPYEALSYVWEQEAGSDVILLCGQPRTVTRNLFLALRRLRKPEETRIVWVDALCICQENDEEKSHQVRLMGEIYKRCAKVCIWVGEYATSSSRFNYGNYRPWGPTRSDYNQGQPDDNVDRTFKLLTELAGNKHFNDISCCEKAWPEEAVSDVFCAFMDSPWWKRLWVVQETVLPRQAVFFFGSGSVDWNIIAAASRLSHLHLSNCCQDAWRDMNLHLKDSWNLFLVVFAQLAYTRLHLGELENIHISMWRWRSRRCTDPRDKVYALLGLITNIPVDMEPDYSLTKRDVYENITLLSIRQTRLLHILKGQRLCVGEIPTWIYDWSLAVDEKSWIFELNRLIVSLYNASGSKEAIVSEAGESKLSLAGVCVDHVVAVGQRYAFDIRTIKGGNIVLSWYEMAKKFYMQELIFHDPDLTNPSHQRNQFRRALTADITRVSLKKQRASLEEDPDFEAWWSCVQKRQLDLVREDEVADRFNATLVIMAADRSFFITQSGYMGLGCPQEGDEIWVLLGGDTPFVLRPVPNSDEYCLVGDCFLHGVMDGEAVVDLETRQRTVVLR